MQLTANILNEKTPAETAKIIAGNMRLRRLEVNLSQQELSAKSGVSLGSLKRFEHSGEISLQHLLLLALVLHATDDFQALFSQRSYQTITEVVNYKSIKLRKRASKKK